MSDATTMLMQALAGQLDVTFNGSGPRKNGFVLLVFPFDGPEGARVNYVSNADRLGVLSTLKEVIARFEGQPLQKGTA